jgi:hypothetical protein
MLDDRRVILSVLFTSMTVEDCITNGEVSVVTFPEENVDAFLTIYNELLGCLPMQVGHECYRFGTSRRKMAGCVRNGVLLSDDLRNRSIT